MYDKFDLFKLIDEHTRECKSCAKHNLESMLDNLYCPNREIVSKKLRDLREKLHRGLTEGE